MDKIRFKVLCPHKPWETLHKLEEARETGRRKQKGPQQERDLEAKAKPFPCCKLGNSLSSFSELAFPLGED